MITFLFFLYAFRKHKDYNAKIQYSIESGNAGNMFRIDTNTGIIRTNNIPDRESIDKYPLRIRARDLGTPSKWTEKKYVITITDKNDNNPIFQSDYNIVVPENTKANTAVLTVSKHNLFIARLVIVHFSVSRARAKKVWSDTGTTAVTAANSSNLDW